MRPGMKITVVLALSVGTILPIVQPQAVAGAGFTFHGSGYGHGLGMSQWGAYGMAKMGWSHHRILRHFYQGTEVQRPRLPAAVRIGLTTDRSVVHLTAKGGPVSIWERATLVGRIPGGQTWTVAAKPNGFAVKDASRSLVRGRRWGDRATPLVLTYENTGSRVFIPEADAIWYEGFEYARGSIEIDLHDCADGCDERLIARLGMDEYLYGLGEVSASWPVETLRAQAVAARSYAAYAIKRYGLRTDCACHLTDGAGDQTYMGYDRESGTMGDRWVAAVKATSGEAVTYGGSIIQAFYAASDGGHSENVEDVWHGGNDAMAIPWLSGVCDPGESTEANPWTDWERPMDAATVTTRLAPYTGSIGTVTSFDQMVRGVSGRIVTVRVIGSGGSDVISGLQLRAGLGLPDDRVWINADRTISGQIRERYDRLMCAPGLPVSETKTVPGGAQQLFTESGLYRNGRLDLTVWIKGSIDEEYRELGAGAGILGVPVAKVGPLSGIRAASCASCQRAIFARGRIYRSAATGAHGLWGLILETYLANGGASGWLGFPLTRVRDRPDGGVRARFENGSIRCPAGAPCESVAG